MADRKITDLTEISLSSSDDILHLIDFNPSARNTKITLANFFNYIPSDFTLGNSTTGQNLTIYGQNQQGNVSWTAANDTFTINGNTNFTRSLEIGDNTINTSLVMNHYGNYNLYGEANLSSANLIVGNSTNGQSAQFESPTANIVYDGVSQLTVNADSTFLQGNVHFGDTTSGQNLFVWAATSTNPSVSFDKVTGTTKIHKAQVVANTTGALYVDGAVALGNDTTGSDVKIHGNAADKFVSWNSQTSLFTVNGAQQSHGNLTVGDLADQHDFTCHFQAGNVIMKATDSEMTVNGKLTANGIVEVGAAQLGFNTTINGAAAAGKNGLQDGMIQWISGSNKAKFVVNGTDGVEVDGAFCVGSDGNPSDAYFYSDDAGESMIWDGTNKTLTVNSAATQAVYMNANVAFHSPEVGAGVSARRPGFHYYRPNGNSKIRIEKSPFIIGPGGVDTGVGPASAEVDTTMILNTEGTKPDGGVVAALSNDNQAYIYAKQMSGLAQIFVMNSSGAAGGGGTETQISPHNSNGDWCFNEYDGGQRRRRYINMIAVIEKLEALTGETFIHDTFDVDQDWVPVDY
jgi:hypothetical protein